MPEKQIAHMNKYTPDMPENWQERAEELAAATVLSRRQADVQTLSEHCLSRQEIADELDISINTVDEHRQAIKKRVELAEKTVAELGEC